MCCSRFIEPPLRMVSGPFCLDCSQNNMNKNIEQMVNTSHYYIRQLTEMILSRQKTEYICDICKNFNKCLRTCNNDKYDAL